MPRKGYLVVEVEFDDQQSDLEGISNGMDQVLDTARDTIGNAFFPEKDWGEVRVKSFLPLTPEFAKTLHDELTQQAIDDDEALQDQLEEAEAGPEYDEEDDGPLGDDDEET
jgi:hypothetical protein